MVITNLHQTCWRPSFHNHFPWLVTVMTEKILVCDNARLIFISLYENSSKVIFFLKWFSCFLPPASYWHPLNSSVLTNNINRKNKDKASPYVVLHTNSLSTSGMSVIVVSIINML